MPAEKTRSSGRRNPAAGDSGTPTGSRESTELGRQLGAMIRRVRLERELTLGELAERSGLSLAFLSLIENGKATPSMESWSRIQGALECSLVIPVPGSELRDDVFIAHSDNIELLRLREFGIGELRRIEVAAHNTYIAEVTSQEQTFSPPGVASGTVVVNVRRGAIELKVDDEVHPLDAGDWAIFDATRTHSVRRTGGPSTSYAYIAFGPSGYRHLF
jgi:transcriptional regulator with XRE-family HTH domain